ncbi:FkbM family methyltransferase [Dickeya zeae]|uniref:FkbM family methyltransferase n=1 Tax=Dickeya zeae TaxID=204042 RepID=UPI0014431D07|nr:FkbM family methyltransferase [Dickeya zeae]
MENRNHNLSKLVIEKRNHFLDTFLAMKKNGFPIVIVGAGSFAKMILEFLNRGSLSVDYIAVNKEWFKEGDEINGIKVINIEHILNQNGRFNYIIAIQNFSKELKNKLSVNCCDILIFDPSFIGINTSSLLSREFFEGNISSFEDIYHRLSDERSRRALVAFLNQRISARTGFYESEFDPMHYFSEDLILLKDNEVFIDCGAYDGDSINGFLKKIEEQGVGKPAKIIGFEPDEKNFLSLCNNTANIQNCYRFKKGVWRDRAVLHFSSGHDLSSKVTDSITENTIELISIDEVMNGDVVTFIKMDIEGSELEALKGAEKTIKTHVPTLAISVYHKPEDLIEIPKLIMEMNSNYKFYLRAHHPRYAFDLVLYAIHSDKFN